MSNTSTPVRVAILNDYPVVVAGLTLVMARHPNRIRVVGVSGHVEIPEDVDIVLCDTFASGTGDGADLSDLVNRTDAKVVLFAGDLSGAAINAAIEAGVTAYISKRATIKELVLTLEAVRRGEYVPPPTFDGTDVPGVGSWPGRSSRLSSREAEVIAYIARGYTNAQIADSLYLSVNSIKTYIRSGYAKIGVQRRTQAVVWALDNGFLQDPSADPVAPEPVSAVRAAIGSALRVLASAADGTRDLHRTADRRAADLVADEAAQDAVAARYRVEAEAARVRRATAKAATVAWHHEDDPTSQAARSRASEIEHTAATAAAALHKRTTALAVAVAGLVRSRAESVRATRSRLHRRIRTDEATTAADLEAQALAAANAAMSARV